MTKDIFSLKKEIDKLKENKILIKDKILKNNIILYSIFTLVFLCTNLFDFNILRLLINGIITIILGKITSFIINNKEYKTKKEINDNINIKQIELNNLIKKEIIKDKNINYVNDINKNVELDSLEDFVLHNKLRKDYKYNLKKVKKRVRKR